MTPPPENRRAFAFDGGLFQAADRPLTPLVEGSIRPSAPLLMVTLRGGAERHVFSTEDGLRFDGPDRPGMVSFLPARCERRLVLRNVAWSWASITLPETETDLGRVPALCGVRDPVIQGILAELDRLHAGDDGLQREYCVAAGRMLAAYLAGRFGGGMPTPPCPAPRLTGRQLALVEEHVEAHLDRPVRVAVLAALLGLSEGHFHRAFRAATGEAPLTYVGRLRIERAIVLMRDTRLDITEIAASIGFTSPSAFARSFRALMKQSPAAYRRVLIQR